ncbi:hypothetical protein [Scytonema hofmannii]|uniref:hypothetical protein n=1 Tax=Scytonema hofmannii TaxID=34078 RepID=UPI00034D9812|nr:hypothetical protein [Scytonema hofmannii]
MARLILIDNDALLKLARYSLLDESLVVFGCVPTNVRVLATAKYSLLPAKNRLRFCKDEQSAARLEAFLRTSEPLDAGLADPDLLDALNAVQNIDAGEALLLAVGATVGDTLVITGDKRSLIALCTNDSVAQVSNALAGRVVSMEVLFLHLVEQQERSRPRVREIQTGCRYSTENCVWRNRCRRFRVSARGARFVH